jgi:hypothetical protein
MVPILFISHSNILGCDRLPSLKQISSPRFGEARKKDGFWDTRWATTLKRFFLGSLGFLGSDGAHLGSELALGHLLNP